MPKPRPLRPHSVARIVSPASPIEAAQLREFEEMLGEVPIQIQYGRRAFDRDAYLAGCDVDRAADLREAFDDPEVDAVICARGGYGCARLIPYLDLDRMAASGKLFVGFSDVTTLHLALNRRGLPTLHAPMGLTFSVPREAWVGDSFLAALTGKNPISPQAPAGKTLVGGRAAGVVTGGCLCLLTDSLGTPDALDCEGKIVLIEDVDENPHRIDAMLTHLILSDQLPRAAGIVVGEMTRTDERVDAGIGGRPWREIVRDRLAPLGVPTIIEFPFGHCPNMLSLPLGIPAILEADVGTLTYGESLCA